MTITNIENLVVYQNEDNSRQLQIVIDESLNDCNIYLDFEKPDGTKSKVLLTSNTYIIPKALLEDDGYIKCQLVACRGLTFVEKSKMFAFFVGKSINATEYIVDNQSDVIQQLETEKADDISYENNTLQLTAQGTPIGNAVELQGGGFEELIGTDEDPVYFRNLQSGNYLLSGLYMPYLDAGISGHANKLFIQVFRVADKVNVYFTDVENENIEAYETYIEEDNYSRYVLPIKEISLNKRVIDDATNIIYTLMENQSKVENSVAQTLMIVIMFPDNIAAGYTSKLVFKTGATIPTFTVNGNVKWLGDGISNNRLMLQTNKIYTIDFEKDVFDLLGKVSIREA